MTRINLVPPAQLSDQHLIAEYREAFMVLPALLRSLQAGTATTDIPPAYTLGKGHVKFFYDKGLFLHTRYKLIVQEMKYRGFKPDPHRTFPTFQGWPTGFFNGYDFTREEVELSEHRIRQRVNEKPSWYRWTKRVPPRWLCLEYLAAC